MTTRPTHEEIARIRHECAGGAFVHPADVAMLLAEIDALTSERAADNRGDYYERMWADEVAAGKAMRARAEQAERERDEARAMIDDAEAETDTAIARAERAERRADDLSRALTEANERLDAAPHVSRVERDEHARTVRDLATAETVLAHVRAALLGAENDARTARALAESRLRDIDTLCADRAAWTERAEEAESALADVRQRCGGYPDSRVDGDGGIVAVVVRERDEAQAELRALRLEILGRTIARVLPEGRARGTVVGHAEATAAALLAKTDALGLQRVGDALKAERDEARAALVAAEAAREMAEHDADALEAERDEWREVAAEEEARRLAVEEDMAAIVRERNEAQAALVALREAVGKKTIGRKLHGWALAIRPDTTNADVEALDAALAATPATLAGQVEARVLRRAADRLNVERGNINGGAVAWLRALADAAEKEGGR